MTGGKKVLLLGESWVSAATHYKGFDQFASVTFHTGGDDFVAAVKGAGYDVTWLTAEAAVTQLPFTAEELAAYDAIVLSDIGANSILLHPDVWLHGKPVPNRLKLLREWTRAGGGLVMMGGYLTFQGIDGRGRWARTPVEEALPVTCLPYDDRVEVPDGFSAALTDTAHPILKGLGGAWPLLLGANEVLPREDAEVLARLPEEEGGSPLIVAGSFGEGRSVAWTSDVGPHWCPAPFVAWEGYALLWANILDWVTRRT